MHGDIIYIELALKNNRISETISFYESLFSWTFTQSFLTTQAYHMFQTPGRKIAGALDENVVASCEGVQMYIECIDIKTTIQAIEQRKDGSSVIKKETFLSKEYGSYALVVDPSGNRIGLQSSLE